MLYRRYNIDVNIFMLFRANILSTKEIFLTGRQISSRKILSFGGRLIPLMRRSWAKFHFLCKFWLVATPKWQINRKNYFFKPSGLIRKYLKKASLITIGCRRPENLGWDLKILDFIWRFVWNKGKKKEIEAFTPREQILQINWTKLT